MFDRIRSIVLRALRVPAEPTPPLGAPGSVRIFRAAPNFYRLRLVEWLLAQAGAAFGLGLSIVFLFAVEAEIEQIRAQPPAPAAAAVAPADAPAQTAPASARRAKRPPRDRALEPFHQAARFAAGLPPWVLVVAHVLKIGAVLVFLAQLPFSYAAVRLEYEQHWYIVTDRSLRIRHGLVSVLESTMSFANLQQVVVHQGPLQRLLGLADVRVQSAGGGGDQHGDKKHGESLHTGIFRGVANATEIRDLILERLRLFRETGLGDSDERRALDPAVPPVLVSRTAPDTLAAAHELLTEARALRAALAPRG